MIEKPNQSLTQPTPQYNPTITNFNEPPSHINRNLGLNLIESIVEQNQLFKYQQQYLQGQLGKLTKISQNLLSQNISLRSLYKERTHDITKLLNTITINTNQTLSDYQHQQFLIKQLNCSVLKQIKKLAKDVQNLSLSIQQKQQECKQINTAKLILQQQIVSKLKVKIKSDMSKKKISDEKKIQMRQMDQNNALSSEVIELVILNKEIELSINDALNTKRMYFDLQSQKQEWETRYQYLKKEVNKYEKEIQNDQSNLQRITQDKRVKQEKHASVKKALNQEIKKYDKYQRSNQQFQMERQRIKQKINQSKKSYSSTENKITQMREEKVELQQKIRQARQRLKDIQLQKNSNQSIQGSALQTITNIKHTLRKQQQNSQQEASKLRKERKKVQQAIEHHEIEMTALDEKAKKYYDLIKGTANPISQIQKIELMERLKKFR